MRGVTGLCRSWAHEQSIWQGARCVLARCIALPDAYPIFREIGQCHRSFSM